MKIIHTSENDTPKIEELYCFVSVDKGGEGIIGHTFEMDGKMVMMPFVCSDKERVESLKPHARELGKIGNRKIKLIKLTHRHEVEEIIWDGH